MATTQSTQLVNFDLANTFLKANETGTRRHYFNAVTLDNDNGTAIELARIPKGARFSLAAIQTGALGTSVTVSLGDGSDVDRWLVATAHAAAGQIIAYGNAASAVNAYEELTATTSLVLTIAGANAADSIEIQGWVEFIKE